MGGRYRDPACVANSDRAARDALAVACSDG